MIKSDKYLEFENRNQWRSWLVENHNAEKEAYLVIYKKKYAHCGLSLEPATEEALCFGWIDSTLKPINESCYSLRFSPRTANSVWSMRNINRVKRLFAEGKMTDAGMEKIAEAKANGQWQAAYRRERIDQLPKELEASLKKAKGALEVFRALPDSVKKRYIYWVEDAKKEETRLRRIRKIIDELRNE
jgi:uncharacterized protein YdeI (YjbR/CyaY-like superfamily)